MSDVSTLAYIDTTGYNFADFPTFLNYLITGYQAIYGSDVDLDPNTMDGQWITVIANALYDTAAQGASTYNSFAPATSQGVGLSRLVGINGLTRESATNSTANLTIIGVAGTLIQNGSAIDILQQIWNLPSSVTIPSGGSIVVTATAAVQGAITAAANTITTIYTPTLGWQSVNNADDASIGAPVETDAQLVQRQQISTANPSLTVFEGTIGAVANITGVTAVQGYENPTGTTDGNGIPGHSICLVVAGGNATTICETIALHKTPGTGTYGNTSELVYDSQGMPLTIYFSTPTIATIGSVVTLAPNENWSSDYIPLIQTAVANAINAGGIGNTVLYTPLFVAAYLVGTAAYGSFDIISITLNKNGGSYSSANVALDFDEQPYCNASTNVTVTVT